MRNIEQKEYNLCGLIDMHIHSAPDVSPRIADDIELTQQAKEAGMRAILLKSHITLTADRAFIAEKVVGGVRVFGGLALNYAIGGLNPTAVEMGIKMGAKEIWMPTRSAAHVLREKENSEGINILDQEGKLRPEICEIIELIRQVNVILATGHLSPQESFTLVQTAKSQGLRKIIITHPEAHFIRMPLEMQRELTGDGVFFERCFVDTTPLMNETVTIAEIADHIRQIGVNSTVLSTDFGQVENPSPVEGMRAYLSALLVEGFTEKELRQMVGDNPAYLLDL